MVPVPERDTLYDRRLYDCNAENRVTIVTKINANKDTGSNSLPEYGGSINHEPDKKFINYNKHE